MAEQFEGDVTIRDAAGRDVFYFDSSKAALYIGTTDNEGDILIRDEANREVFHFDSNRAALYVGNTGNEGDIVVRDGEGREVFHFDSNRAALYVGNTGNEGDIVVRDGEGREVFHFDSSFAALYVGNAGNEGDVIVRDGNGNERIRLDGHTGDIKLSGADCAEEFGLAAGSVVEGSVLAIDGDGRLAPCTIPYDRRVAGVVSGAGGLQPGIILDSQNVEAGRVPISLNGKVYCRAEAISAPIAAGDLLTTSSIAGHAMKATDPSQAFGAIVGKALQSLEEGTGMIPILVSLQ